MPSKNYLSSPQIGLDRRLNAYRPDLADAALKGQVKAERFVEPQPTICIAPYATLHETPGGEEGSELLKGEHFMLLEEQDGWAWGWCAHDHYVGYVKADALAPATAAPSPAPAHNPVELAESFHGVPYVWGGRGGAGIDCSGLIQRAMAARGVSAMRDSDMQQTSLGRELAPDELLQRGDIIYFPGHVGMMVDSKTLIHATRYYNRVVEEPLDLVVERVKRRHDGVGILARRRVD